MKNYIKKITAIVLLNVLVTSCDSSADAVTPTVVPSTFEFLFVKSPNIATGNSGLLNLKKESTIGTTFTSPALLRTDDFATVASTIPSSTLLAKQCSAYDKVSKKYVVSTGERVLLYDVTTATPPAPNQFLVANVQAMEFANGRFFAIKNNLLNEYNFSSSTPTVPLASFATINLTAGQVSNLTQKGNYLSVISGGHLYVIDITGSGSVTLNHTLPTTDTYEGLEAVNSAGAPFSLFVVKRNASGNVFQEILLTPSIAFTSVTTKYTLSFINDATSKISSALDYTTEFYYLSSSNGATSDAFSVTAIDLTPTNTSTYMPITVTNPGNHFAFGLQLKD
jgi:hypothetical protein